MHSFNTRFTLARRPTSKIAVAAAQKALSEEDHFYQPNSGKPALRRCLQHYMNRLYALNLDISSITVTGSGMQAMMLSAQALTDPGDKIIVVGPAWPNLAESFWSIFIQMLSLIFKRFTHKHQRNPTEVKK